MDDNVSRPGLEANTNKPTHIYDKTTRTIVSIPCSVKM